MWLQSFGDDHRFNFIYPHRLTWYLAKLQYFNDDIFLFHNMVAGLNQLGVSD